MITETIQYYTEIGCKGVFLLLLNASKDFDKVVFDMLFNELFKKNVCPKIIKLLLYMYTKAKFMLFQMPQKRVPNLSFNIDRKHNEFNFL